MLEIELKQEIAESLGRLRERVSLEGPGNDEDPEVVLEGKVLEQTEGLPTLPLP